MSAAASPERGLVAELRAIVGESGLVLGEDAAARSCDPLRNVPPGSAVIVRPANTAEVSQVLALCHSRGQRVVTHGGRTGVAGGAYVDPDEIVLSLERMNAIEEIDATGLTAVVQAGVAVQALHERAAAEGLLYPVDLGSKGSATIGGTISTNAGGNRTLRWGMTRQNVLGLEAVLSDGTVVSAMNRLVKNNTGYDVKQLFIGAEGTLGVVTRAVVKLVPTPSTQLVALMAVPDFSALLELLTRARRMQTLSAFEVMWRDYYEVVAASGSGRSPVAPSQPYYLLIEAMGYDEAYDAPLFDTFLELAALDGLVADAVKATSGRQVAELWRVREGAEVLVREMSPFVSFDVSVEVSRAEAFVDAAKAALARHFPHVRTATFGHLGDNNLHMGVHVGPDTLAREVDIEACVYDVVREFAGALTAEHGVGRLKRAFLPQHVSPAALETMRRVRSALDPETVLNRQVLF
jgi:FAD/FMN-containing dehydrogenase